MKSPEKIPGLKLWWDASDASTVNNGKAIDNQNVFRFVDKVGGFSLTNNRGLLGPKYWFGAVNEKNVISFEYNEVDSISYKRLAGENIKPLESGTYSLFCVHYPNDRRFEPSRRMWIMSIFNKLSMETKRYTDLPFEANRGISVGAYTTNRNLRIEFVESLNNSTPTTQFRDNSTDLFLGATAGVNYQYGKVNISIMRSRQNVKKYSIIRSGSALEDNFVPRTSLQTSQIVTTVEPVLTIGAWWPDGANSNNNPFPKTLISQQYSTSTDNGGWFPYEGYFCELLFWDRLLTDSESNSIKDYLIQKWVQQKELPPFIPPQDPDLILWVDSMDPRSQIGGSIWNDISDANNDVNISTVPFISDNVSGIDYYEFNAVSGQFMTSNAAVGGSQSRTISIWFFITQSNPTNTVAQILGYGGTNNTNTFGVGLGGIQNCGVNIGNGSILGAGNTIINPQETKVRVNVWQNYTFTYVSGNDISQPPARRGGINGFRNGLILGSNPTPQGGLTTSTAQLRIGNSPYSASNYNPFRGRICIIKMWKRAISDLEILAEWDAYRGRFGLTNSIIPAAT